jgi:hypothetical protein
MPTRMIRDGILTSERINALTERAELFYRRLMSVVDDYGRFSANLTLLRASCYPLKLDSVKEDSIKKHLAEAVDAGLIVLYTVGAKPYLQLQDFGQRIQGKSKYPDIPETPSVPPESTVDHGELPESTALDGDEVEVAIKGEAEKEAGPEPSPATPTPAFLIPLADGSEFAVTQAHIDDFAPCYPGVDIPHELRRMRGWALANPKKRKTRGGCLKFIANWLGSEQNKPGQAKAPSKPSAADNFAGKTYQGTPIDELRPSLRAAARAALAAG